VKDCASILKVLADKNRLKVVEVLMDGPLHVHEINGRVKIPQNLLSHHLRVLRKAGVVSAARDGKSVTYQLTIAAKGHRSLNLGCCRLSFV
jgi:ArsR family transcriptional regulator